MYMNCMRYMDVTVKPISSFWNSNHLSPVFGGSTYKDIIFRGDKSGYGWVWLKTSSKEDHKLWSFWNRGNPNLMDTFQVPCQHKPQLTQAFSSSLLSRLLDFSLLSWGSGGIPWGWGEWLAKVNGESWGISFFKGAPESPVTKDDRYWQVS